ncbi:sarcosine oxidase subunit gamma [Algihabitans albus]|uniref:sarcosine oxidase subunit gamma n=1 Tax=Algihabitans albus TaxID=2164067 RepID=UPI000E5CFAE1|nr:sarcosine oxidase subunit gamma family protein [Algihabitans albus]
MPEVRAARRLGSLAGIALPTRVEVEGEVEVTLAVSLAPSIVTVEARPGAGAEMARRIAERFGSMPEPARWIGPAPLVLHSAPDSLLVLAEHRPEGELADELRALLGETASPVDNSHGRALIRLAGLKARDLLAFGTALDLAPERFPVGAGAATLLGHIAVTLLLRDDAPETGPVFEIVVARGFAESLWEWLIGRAGRFGYEVTAPDG